MQEKPAGAEAVRLLEAVREAGAKRAVHLASDETRAEAIVRFLAAAAPDVCPVFLPPWDCLPYDWAPPSAAAMGARMRALRAAEGERCLVVTSPGGLLQRVPPAAEPWRIEPGYAVEAETLAEWLRLRGYAEERRVEEPGQFAVRGEVIDLFPAGAGAVRLVIEGGAVTAMHHFDPVTQLSDGDVEAVALDPATELPPGTWERGAAHRLPEHRDDLALLPERGLAVFASEGGLATAEEFLGRLAPTHAERLEVEIASGGAGRPLPPERLHATAEEWAAMRDGLTSVSLEGVEDAPAVAAEARPRAALRALVEAGPVTMVAASDRDARRMRRMAGGGDVLERWSDHEGAAVLRAPLRRGFRMAGRTVLAAPDVLGPAAEGEGAATVVPPWLADAQDLAAGDLVVSEADGLGRYEGLEAVEGGEAIRVAFDGTTVLVPVREAGHLWRYGEDTGEVSLDKPGGKVWAKRRATFEREVEETAARLAEAAEARAEAEAPVLEPKRAAMATVAAGFPFAPTPDQRAAFAAVLGDLKAGRPMRRIVVGDVGFGKTEVAIRAAAAAISAGAQVAVVAPTTVLAMQHAATFRRRLPDAEVAALSRLAAKGERNAVREGLADGSVDVVVGTHAILGTEFARLGLVVIDEEQRFGQAHKEGLRALAEGVHALSMTATPIPRSLQGAIVGLQSLSVLATAPLRRRPVRTVVEARADPLVRDALLREWRRGGRSFVVVPRIEDIEGVEASLAGLVPDLSIVTAHGRMKAVEIDRAMTDFAAGRGDVLVATSLVEAGLDVPGANTMVVLRPDLLGLAQLHQLRGRVGRGARQAFCWLLTEGEVPEGAAKRLETFAAHEALGAGFALSLADMDRRGAGDLFGDRQTGHEARVGPALHAEMLARALQRARGEADLPPPDLRLGDGGALPADYIPREDVRATLYGRLARVRDEGEAVRLADEVEDRFGPPPPEAAALLAEARVRAIAARLGASAVSVGPKAVAVDFHPGCRPEAPGGATAKEDRLVWALDEAPEDPAAVALAVLETLEG